MNIFPCPERKAEATLKFPLLVVRYESPWVTPNLHEHEIYRVTLVHQHPGWEYTDWSPDLCGPDMPDIAGFLSTLDPRLIKWKKWDFDQRKLTLMFTETVSVGEHVDVETIFMYHYIWWADTDAMNQARAVGALQRATEARIAARMGM